MTPGPLREEGCRGHAGVPVTPRAEPREACTPARARWSLRTRRSNVQPARGPSLPHVPVTPPTPNTALKRPRGPPRHRLPDTRIQARCAAQHPAEEGCHTAPIFMFSDISKCHSAAAGGGRGAASSRRHPSRPPPDASVTGARGPTRSPPVAVWVRKAASTCYCIGHFFHFSFECAVPWLDVCIVCETLPLAALSPRPSAPPACDC